jgi:hypothetical protein
MEEGWIPMNYRRASKTTSAGSRIDQLIYAVSRKAQITSMVSREKFSVDVPSCAY